MQTLLKEGCSIEKKAHQITNKKSCLFHHGRNPGCGRNHLPGFETFSKACVFSWSAWRVTDVLERDGIHGGEIEHPAVNTRSLGVIVVPGLLCRFPFLLLAEPPRLGRLDQEVLVLRSSFVLVKWLSGYPEAIRPQGADAAGPIYGRRLDTPTPVAP
jgi:hypothetical protein